MSEEIQSLEMICEIGDAAVRALEAALGEQPCIPYPEASADRQSELEAGVQYILGNAASPLSAQHDAWRARNFGRLRLDDPRLVPFDKLPPGLQLKARLWRHIVHAVVG